MIPKPGQRVYTICADGGHLPAGRYTGTVVGLHPKHGRRGWWDLNLDGYSRLYAAHQDYIFPLDPPKSEPLGEWDLCPWRPAQPVTVPGAT